MNVRRGILACAACCLALGLAPQSAQAQAPGCYGNWGWGWGTPYSFYIQDRIPYYAMNPPVYYQWPPVKRPYGYSPFAYPPGVMTPEPVRPKVVTNPYVDRATLPAAATAPDRQAARGRIIVNPYYDETTIELTQAAD